MTKIKNTTHSIPQTTTQASEEPAPRFRELKPVDLNSRFWVWIKSYNSDTITEHTNTEPNVVEQSNVSAFVWARLKDRASNDHIELDEILSALPTQGFETPLEDILAHEGIDKETKISKTFAFWLGFKYRLEQSLNSLKNNDL